MSDDKIKGKFEKSKIKFVKKSIAYSTFSQNRKVCFQELLLVSDGY